VVLAAGPSADNVVCGLPLAERGRRVAMKSGASRVLVVREQSTAALEHWYREGDGRGLLVVQVSEQVVHLPLVAAVQESLVERSPRPAMAVTPGTGTYAGALWIPEQLVAQALPELARDPVAGDRALAARWRADADVREHGEIARHPARTAAERRAATKMLFGLVHKKQDSLLSRYVNRRVSYPLTRLALPTPITPNMLSVLVFAVGLLACWITSHPGYWDPVIGCSLLLLGGYLDGCDGEVARLRLETSLFGAWLDTVVDETTSILFVAAIGLHVHARSPSPWVLTSLVVAVGALIVSAYAIYYYLVVVSKTGNSQDYPTPSGGVWEPARLLIRRDVINAGALVFAVAGHIEILFGISCFVAVVTAAVLVPEHLRLRLSRRRAAPESQTPVA
jgi:phosphatidylglycerophosphate synthase